MAIRMQQRRGTAAQWISTHDGDGPILNPGELGFETDTGKFKIGDGVNHWVDLDYFLDESEINSITGDYVLTSTLGQNGGVATLDGSGKLTSSQIPNIDEISQEAVNNALVAGTGLDKTYNDNANTITLDIDSTVATKSFAAGLLTNAIKTNITITGDENGLTISAESGVAESTTSDLVEGTNLYFTDERAQDAVGNNVGSGLTYTDATGEIKVTPNTYDAYGSASAVAGDLSTHASDTTNIHGIADTAALATKTYADSAVSTAVSGLTKSSVGLGNVDNTSDADKPVSTATQIEIDTKVSKSGSTMTGSLTLSGAPTSDLHAATKLYVDNLSAGINFHAAVHAATTENLSADYNNGTNGVGATLTATANGTWTTLDGHSSFTQYDRILVKDQTDAKQNGIYILSDLGSGSSKWILTRATDADNNPTGEMKNGDFVFVTNGTVNASYGFVNNSSTNPIAIGTDNITYTSFNAAKTVTAGNGLQEATPGVISIDTSITQTRVSGVSDTEIAYLDGVTSGIQGQIDAKLASSTAASTYAPIANPTFTGTVSGVTKSMVGLGNVDNTADADKPVSSAAQTALNLKADLNAPTFTGAVVLPETTAIGNVSATEIGHLDGVTSGIQSQIDSKAPIASPTFTGTVSGITKSMVGLSNVDNTSDANKPVSTAQQTAIDARIAKADITAKGAILVGTGSGTYTAQTVGTNGQVLTANSAQADGIEWTTISSYSAPTIGSTVITSGGTFTTLPGVTSVNGTTIPSSATLLTSTSTSSNLTSFGTSPTINTPIINQGIATPTFSSNTYTFVAGDAGKILLSSNGSTAGTLYIPTNASVGFAIGTEITIIQIGSGTLTLTATTPATTVIYSSAVTTASPKFRTQYSSMTAIKTGTDTWYVVGDIT